MKALFLALILLSVGRNSFPRSVNAFLAPGATPSRKLATLPMSAGASADDNEGHDVSVVVVGGGLSGLATALALRSIAKLTSVRVLEVMPSHEFNNEYAGAAIQLGPNGLRALGAIGGEDLMNRVCSSGSTIKAGAVISPGSGNDISSAMATPNTVEEDTGLPQILIRWGVLRKLISDLIKPDSVITDVGRDIVGYALQNNDGGNVIESMAVSPIDAKGKTLSEASNFIVGADGLNSVLRRCVFSNTKTVVDESGNEVISRGAHLKDNGRVNVKAVAPTDLSPPFEPNTTYSFFTGDYQIACFAGPAGPGYTYWAVSIADSDGAHFLPSDPIDLNDAKQRVLAKLKDANAPECQFVIDLVERTDANTIMVRRSEEASTEKHSLVSEDLCVVLVGDAAHAMNAAYGQAASFAFEDAATLATCIRQDAGDLGLALKRYSKSRLGRVIEMQRRSEERAAKAMRGEKVEDISKWIYEWDIDQEKE